MVHLASYQGQLLAVTTMSLNPQFPADMVTFTEEIRNGKLHFLCNDWLIMFQVTSKSNQLSRQLHVQNQKEKQQNVNILNMFKVNNKDTRMKSTHVTLACLLLTFNITIMISIVYCSHNSKLQFHCKFLRNTFGGTFYIQVYFPG